MLAIGDPGWSSMRRSQDDAKILKTVCVIEERLQNPYGYTFIDIISYLNTEGVRSG